MDVADDAEADLPVGTDVQTPAPPGEECGDSLLQDASTQDVSVASTVTIIITIVVVIIVENSR